MLPRASKRKEYKLRQVLEDPIIQFIDWKTEAQREKEQLRVKVR